MKSMNVTGLAAIVVIALAACDQSDTPEEPTAGSVDVEVAKPVEQLDAKAGSPFAISYEIVGTPIVGSPVTLDLKITSSIGHTPLEVSYQIPDDSSMMLHESQPRTVAAEFADNEELVRQRVTIVPLRDGRLYLNVGAAADVEGGTLSSMMSIPIHVGTVDTGLAEHGEVEITEDGEAIKVLRD